MDEHDDGAFARFGLSRPPIRVAIALVQTPYLLLISLNVLSDRVVTSFYFQKASHCA